MYFKNFVGLETKTLALNRPPQVGGGIDPLWLVGPRAGYWVFLKKNPF
jgi:hypothetical protein